jgi:pyruvate,water dikinase
MVWNLVGGFAVIVQTMIFSDKGASGVILTYDPERYSASTIIIEAVRGIGEILVQGHVVPDHYKVFKLLADSHHPILMKRIGNQESALQFHHGKLTQIPLTTSEKNSFVLSDEEIIHLSRAALYLETSYADGTALDIEWAKDGISGELVITQMRAYVNAASPPQSKYIEFHVETTDEPLITGIGIGFGIETRQVSIIRSLTDFEKFEEGSILVAPFTDPQWMPLMLRASGFITDQGSASSHAAIVARELNLPCIVGTNTATQVLMHQQQVSMWCADDGIGRIYDQALQYNKTEFEIDIPKTRTELLLHIGIPDTAFHHARLPSQGVGAARTEFVSTSVIGIHPKFLLDYEILRNNDTPNGMHHFNDAEKRDIRNALDIVDARSRGYEDKREFYISLLAHGIAQIASAFYPRPIFSKLSDFKTNEYRDMLGGVWYEPYENNPMLGWRGSARYYDPDFYQVFEMECEAFRRVRIDMGLDNLNIMVPFCRSVDEARTVHQILDQFGLSARNGTRVFALIELPSQVFQADNYLDIFDGFLLGLNDLYQTMLGVDRDSSKVAHLLDPHSPAVYRAIEMLITAAKRKGKQTRAIGQILSTDEELIRFLVQQRIDGIVVSPDPATITRIANVIAQTENSFLAC